MTTKPHQQPTLLPRLIRLRDAAFYLGMDKNRFSTEVRPFVTEIRMGIQGVAFDRLELDAWAEQYKSRNGRPGQPIGETTWDAKEPRGSKNAKVSGTSTKGSTVGAFARALDQINLQKPKSYSQS